MVRLNVHIIDNVIYSMHKSHNLGGPGGMYSQENFKFSFDILLSKIETKF